MSTSEFTKYMIAKGVKQLLETKDFEQISEGTLQGSARSAATPFTIILKIKRRQKQKDPRNPFCRLIEKA